MIAVVVLAASYHIHKTSKQTVPNSVFPPDSTSNPICCVPFKAVSV